MQSLFQILLPIFGIMLAGYCLRRCKLLGPTAASELNKYVVWLALPALLFDVTSRASWQVLYQPGFIATFAIGSSLVFGATLLWRMRTGAHLADASIDAISASYANTGFIGFPLCLMVFGEASVPVAAVATIWVICVSFACAIVLIEIGLKRERAERGIDAGAVRQRGAVLVSLAKNPLVIAPFAGIIVSALHVTMPAGVQGFLKLTGASAGPCALASLGLFLAGRDSGVRITRTPWLLSAMKLLAMPALTWLLATYVFHLDALHRNIAVLLAALPTGTGPYMLAELYGRQAHVTSQTILISTVVSLLTLSLILVFSAA